MGDELPWTGSKAGLRALVACRNTEPCKAQCHLHPWSYGTMTWLMETTTNDRRQSSTLEAWVWSFSYAGGEVMALTSGELLASLPEEVKGFGHVKAEHYATAKKREADLLKRIRSPSSTPIRQAAE